MHESCDSGVPDERGRRVCGDLAAVNCGGGAVQDRLNHADLPIDRYIVSELARRPAILEKLTDAGGGLIMSAAHLLGGERLRCGDNERTEPVGEMPRRLQKPAECVTRVAIDLDLPPKSEPQQSRSPS